MDFKDCYATLGVERTASPADIKRAYRKLARKYHPDLSKEPNAEERFKDVAEAYEALNDAERRAAYDELGSRQARGQEFNPPPGGGRGFGFDGVDGQHSDFFEALFGHRARGDRGSRANQAAAGGDHHAKVQVDLQDSYRGGHRSISLQSPHTDPHGKTTMRLRQLDVNIPKGIRAGQHLRLAGQGNPGSGTGPAGDLYLEIEFAPDRHFRVDGRDVYVDVAVAPWEAALGASIEVSTPDGGIELGVPPGSPGGRKLRLKGKGIPSSPPGDLYAVLVIALPPATTAPREAAYRAMAAAFGDFNPRGSGATWA